MPKTRTITFGLTAMAALVLAAPRAAISAQVAPFPVATTRVDVERASVPVPTPAPAPATQVRVEIESATPEERVDLSAQARLQDDLQAMSAFRPGYAFWQHVFAIPDGSIAYGSGTDGRLLAVFPAQGDWSRLGAWEEPSLRPLLSHSSLSTRLAERRDEVARIFEQNVGPVLHNPTRGRFVSPNAQRYGQFLTEWGRIYERFGVPADLGLAQGLIESGLNGTVRSEARAIGFCQWLTSNWNALKRLSPHVIEGYNQTTQAPYCAAYLTVLGTKYGSFIPALSEHHAGGTNVGRTLHNGQWLGGHNVREHYFLGAAFTRDLRTLAPRTYSDVYGTYGPRSYFYSEMVFGNIASVQRIKGAYKQVPIYAMRTSRAIPLTEITQRTRLSADEIRRYNPALVRQVPARATLYLPMYVSAFGTNVTFWQRPPSAAYATVLSDFLNLDHRPEEWDTPDFVPVLRGFEMRFRQTKTEEGTVMATVLAYVINEILTSGRGAILEAFRSSPEVRQLFEQAVIERNTALGLSANSGK